MKRYLIILFLLIATPLFAADTKITDLDVLSPDATDMLYCVDDVSGTPTSKSCLVSALLIDGNIPNSITIDNATTAATANSGDSATSFFSSGTLEVGVGGTGVTTSTGTGATVRGTSPTFTTGIIVTDVFEAVASGVTVINHSLTVTGALSATNLSGTNTGDQNDHGTLDGLSDDDHTQYLLADGTRALAGAWSLGNQNLTNGGTITGTTITGTTSLVTTGGLIEDTDNEDLVLRTNSNANQLVLDSAGNVGIGTTGPSSILHLVDGSLPAITFGTNGVLETIGSIIINIDSNDTLTTQSFVVSHNATGLGGTELFKVEEDGKVTITTGGKLLVGSTQWTSSGADTIDGAALEDGSVIDDKIPNDITIDLATLASTVTVIDSTDATSFLAMFDSATGSLPVKTDLGLTYNASTGDLSSTLIGGITLANLVDKEATEVLSGDWTIPILSGKSLRSNTAVDDDDCTGEQGKWWYDTTDLRFEYCNADSGTPSVVTGLSAGTVRIPILDWHTIPDTSGQVFFEPYTIKASVDNWEHGHWIFNDNSTRNELFGVFAVPQDYSDGANVVIVWTTTATSGDVEWDFDYNAVGGTETIDGTVQQSVNSADTAPSATDERTELTIALTDGNFAAGDTVTFLIARDASDGGDTITAVAVQLVELFFEYDQ